MALKDYSVPIALGVVAIAYAMHKTVREDRSYERSRLPEKQRRIDWERESARMDRLLAENRDRREMHQSARARRRRMKAHARALKYHGGAD